ncbi:hypothetical protein ACU4I5_05755 [Ensifer adhaerens]
MKMKMTPEQHRAAIEALQASRGFLRQFKAVVVLADALEKMGELWNEICCLEAAKSCLEISIIGLNEKKSALTARVDELQAEVDSLEAKIRSLKERFA